MPNLSTDNESSEQFCAAPLAYGEFKSIPKSPRKRAQGFHKRAQGFLILAQGFRNSAQPVIDLAEPFSFTGKEQTDG